MRKTVGVFLVLFLLAVFLVNTKEKPSVKNGITDGSQNERPVEQQETSPEVSLEPPAKQESNAPDTRVVAELERLLRSPVSDDYIENTVAAYSAGYEFTDEEIVVLAKEYGNTAINIAKEHGRQGGVVLLALGQQGVAIMRERGDDFRRIAERFGGETAAAFLISYNNDFAEIVRANGLASMLDRIETLHPASKRIAEKKPELFPFLLMAENKVREAWAVNHDACITCFSLLALEKGPEGVAEMADMIVRHGRDAAPWIQARGMDGLLLANFFPEILKIAVKNHHHTPMELSAFLQILSNNQNDLRHLFSQGTITADDVWRTMKKIRDVDDSLRSLPDDFDKWSDDDLRRFQPYRGNFLELASDDPHLLRLLLDKGNAAIQLIIDQWAYGGQSLPNLLYEAYDDGKEDDTALFDHAWDALTRSPGKEPHVLAMLFRMAQFDGRNDKEPNSSDFRALLYRLDHRVVMYLAESDASSQKFDALKDRGIDELNSWVEPTSMAVEMIPGYDASRLVWVLSKGYVPRKGEVAFAAVDVAFTAMDIATWWFGGTIPTQVARKGLKTTGKKVVDELAERGTKKVSVEMSRKLGRVATDEVAETLARRSFYSPKNLEFLVKQDLIRKVANNLQLSEQSLRNYKKIRVLCRSLTAQWSLGMALGTGLQQGVKMVPALPETEKNGEVSLWGQKAKDYLIYMNDTLNAPAY